MPHRLVVFGKMTRTLVTFAGLSLVSAANAQSISAFFVCDAGKTVRAIFINDSPASVKLSLSDGRNLTLLQVMSASGARYANADESFVFWDKGNTAFIEELGKTTYRACTVRR
jgi:membrane-bound inhibitor of C-type lysozyme